MYQRSPAQKPASMNDRGSMATVQFLDRCSENLERSGKTEAAFYFEQLVDHLRNGGSMDENQDINLTLGL